MQICDFKFCTGCSACLNICPTDAISMIENEEGFLYPNIDENKCINCNKCKAVCPANNPVTKALPIKVFAAWSKDDITHKTSASGGIATEFGKKIIEDDGAVFGAKCEIKDNKINLFHTKADNLEELESFKGSKYFQSEIGTTFKEVKSLLDDNKKVFFCGTPCQVAGLKSYLNKDYDNLILADIICHGVPSKKSLNMHIAEVLGDEKISKISFRDKGNYALSLFDKAEKIIYKKPLADDNYLVGFLSGLFFRKSCYSCPYADKMRISDITLGDFWGLGRDVPFERKISNGVSVCLINSDNGLKFFMSVADNIESVERTLDEAVSGNNQLQNPSREKFCSRDKFFKNLKIGLSFNKSVLKSAGLARLKYKVLKIIK